jgi:hypothetical protein
MTAIDQELLQRLPRTFVPALNEQLDKWDLLFPGEQRTLRNQLDYLAGLSPSDFAELFRPVKDVEARMQLPAWEPSSRRIGISDTSVLVRSPYYPQWRSEVEKIFARIDNGVEGGKRRRSRRSVVACLLPAGLPLPAGVLWPRLAQEGPALALRAAFGDGAEQFLLALARHMDSAAHPAERTWVFETGDSLSRTFGPSADGVTLLSFEALAAARKAFLERLNAIKKDLHSADQTFDDLRRMDPASLMGKRRGRDLRLSSFVRDLFLSGNGALLFGNAFVEWGASEALRRAQPQFLICSFGMRHKLKPFSSVAVFEDQARANPAPEVDDAPSSLIDTQILAEYVYLTASRLPSYAGQTLGLFAVHDSKSIQVLGPAPSTGWPSEPLTLAELDDVIERWMEEGV